MSQSVWRVIWQHPTSRDEFVGDVWDRETAEFMAEQQRQSGCRNVRIVRWADARYGGEAYEP